MPLSSWNIMNRNIYLLFTILIFISCGTSNSPFIKNKDWINQQPSSSIHKEHTIWLIGDSGYLDDKLNESNYVVDGMVSMIDPEDTSSTIIFLGDNIYPDGMVEENHPFRKDAESILKGQIIPLEHLKSQVFFIPGNHDWNSSKSGGRDAVILQERFLENYFLEKEISFIPDNSCGDPQVRELNDQLVIIFIDSHWFLHDWTKEIEMNKGCELQSREELFPALENLFIKYKDHQVVLAMHHPIKTNGLHGGNFPLKDHIFPLNHYKIWLPLPIIGSTYPLYKKIFGSHQDVTNKTNQKLINTIKDIAHKFSDDCIFVSGHDHGLQYFEEDNLQFIVSGSGAKTDHVKTGGEALYARSSRGFAKIDFYINGDTWVEFYTLSGAGMQPILEYRHPINTSN